MHTEILQIFYSKATRLKDISTLELKLIKIISNELKKLESNDLLPLSNRKVLFNYQFIQILSKRNEFIKNSITAYNLTKKLKKKKLISSKSIMYPKNIKFFSTNPLDSSFLYSNLSTVDQVAKVFETFVKYGAQEEILYHYKPHIGTDILKNVVQNMRNEIIKLGGEFRFESQVTDFRIISDEIKAIEINKNEWLEFDYVVLGIGHSARDTYRKLYDRGVFMENKDFAIGVRIEHPREDIDKMQYGDLAGHPHLGAATYNYTYNNTEQKRGVFSFCMCPGGEIVNASSVEGHSLVNGMSYSTRDGEFSNSAVVVAVRKDDFGSGVFDGMKYQENIERKAFETRGTHGALYQNLSDFINNKKSVDSIKTSYGMGLTSVNFNEFFPNVIKDNMQLAFKEWSRNKYFVSNRANLIGPETRTSAPIRITRDGQGISLNIKNLFPIGEGAGYAGGIVSAAIDGVKIIDKNFAVEE